MLRSLLNLFFTCSVLCAYEYSMFVQGTDYYGLATKACKIVAEGFHCQPDLPRPMTADDVYTKLRYYAKLDRYAK